MSEQMKRKSENARTNMKIAVALSDLSAAEISQRAGLSINVLGKYLRGESMISFANMQAICDVINVPIALIASSQSINPARVRLMRKIENMSDREIEAFLASDARNADT